MRFRGTLLGVIVAVVLAGCGSSSKASDSSSTTTPLVLEVAGPVPSESAKMVCAPEAQEDIAAVLGVATARAPAPKWTVGDHVYRCTYAYPGGASVTLSVKELSSEAETTRFFEMLANELGRAETLHDIGGDGYTTRNNSAVVRKDYKVLLVDVSKLPSSFGRPPQTPRQAAVSVASTIMGCWTGR